MFPRGWSLGLQNNSPNDQFWLSHYLLKISQNGHPASYYMVSSLISVRHNHHISSTKKFKNWKRRRKKENYPSTFVSLGLFGKKISIETVEYHHNWGHVRVLEVWIHVSNFCGSPLLNPFWGCLQYCTCMEIWTILAVSSIGDTVFGAFGGVGDWLNC